MTILFTIVASFVFDTAGTVIQKSTRLRCNVMLCLSAWGNHSVIRGGISYCGFKLGIKDHVILLTARMGFEIVTTTWAAIK